jgi:hypothetical protein
MFSNPVRVQSFEDEGTVCQVDALRGVCKIQTKSGQNLDGVLIPELWGGSSRAGGRITLTYGDRVMVSFTKGYPRITEILPRIQSASQTSFPVPIATGSTIIDTGNYAPGGGVQMDLNRPPDTLVGDVTFSSIGGAFLGLLRAGSVILRSSRLSEIFLCKLDDLVRITSRNFEHYTDVCSDVIRNIGGRVYRFVGYTNSFANSASEAYQYNEYFGDTALAEAAKSSGSGSATANNIIFKEQVYVGSELYHRTLDLSGNQEVYITGGGLFTRVTSSATGLTLSYGDQNSVSITQTNIVVNYNNAQTATFDANQIVLVHNSGAQALLNADGVANTFGGHFVKVTSGGVQMG